MGPRVLGLGLSPPFAQGLLSSVCKLHKLRAPRGVPKDQPIAVDRSFGPSSVKSLSLIIRILAASDRITLASVTSSEPSRFSLAGVCIFLSFFLFK